MSFATPSDLEQRYDVRSIGDLLADDNTVVDPVAMLTNANLQTALDDAAGEIVAAAISNGHYTTAGLVTLAAAGLPSSFLLKKLNCALALPNCFGRRIYNQDEIAKRIPDFKWAQDLLEMLKNGQRVFELPVSNVNAGVMATADIGANIVGGLVGHKARCFGITPVNINSPN